MLRFIVVSFLVSFCVKAQNSTNNQLCANLVASPNFDSPSVYQVTQPVDHAEGPIWDGRKNVLYYVDIHSGRVLSYNYNTKKVNFITLKGNVSPVIPAKNNENILIVGVDRSLVAIEWDGEKVGNQRVITSVSSQFPQSRFNDGKADKNGRVWIGTMGFENLETGALEPNQGILYKLTRETLISPKVEISPVNVSNGLCWNKANNKMYYIDSPTRKVVEYDYDEEKGEISNPKVVIDITKYPLVTGVPDGMTIDKDDNLWIALFGGGAVIKANPKNGQLLQIIPIPARDVTSVAWGGPKNDILFVSTSRRSLSKDLRKTFNAAGSIFAITNLRTNGFPANFADLVDTVKRANLLAEILLNTNDLFSSPPSKEAVSRSNLEQNDVPFWMTVINSIRNIF